MQELNNDSFVTGQIFVEQTSSSESSLDEVLKLTPSTVKTIGGNESYSLVESDEPSYGLCKAQLGKSGNKLKFNSF
jgi:hypothetical protein